jgi:2,4-dienoyl-CoA reductase-like NADH-dependent reductase (Old Yellow Enzyme family)
MAHLFDPYTVRGVTLRNRVGVSPMCQYSCADGFASDWHLVHLGARATGGAGLVCVEATAVEPRGRISPQDMGIWKDEHVEPLARIARFVASQGAVPAIQLAHAGRKGSTLRPWDGSGRVEVEQGGWQPVAPSALPFDDGWHVPHALTAGEIAEITGSFVLAAKRARAAGFQWIELHFAHGYLAHEFLSPLSNTRTDAYGGSFDARVRFALETTRAVRAVWPQDLPLAARLSCTDWVEGGGWTLEDSVSLSRKLAAEGVDLVDCSSGGNVPRAKIPVGPGYQVPFAQEIRRSAGVATSAVGLITEARQAEAIVSTGKADMVMLARATLRDPYWALHAALELGDKTKALAMVPVQYQRAF